MLNVNDSLVLVIDIQEKLVNMLNAPLREEIAAKSQKLIKAARILGVDTLTTEQYPKGLGTTIEGIREILKENYKPYEKTAFCALFEEPVLEALRKTGRKQIVLLGIEAHICVYQSALELINQGYEVIIAKDICASRNDFEFNCAMDLLRSMGAKISCLEIILFEWLKGAGNPNFKEVQALIK